MNIEHIANGDRGTFVIRGDGEPLAEMTYVKSDNTNFTIDHTKVNESLRGKGMGKRLITEGVKYARENNLKIKATCPFALEKLKENAGFSDVFLD